MMTLAQAHAMLPGSTLIGDGSLAVERVHSDTRTLRSGDLFVALKGERFDGHDMLADAKARGAVAALAQRGLAEAGLAGLLVADTQRALEDLARAWRAHHHLPLVAVTGSNGKTTVTQMIAAILRAWLGDAAFATEGNLNNHIGVPLTLLRLRQDDARWHRAGVVELGMNHVGEIAQLARIAQPTIALVNNAQREHQEFMTTVEAVARENGAVIEALPAGGTAAFPADDEYTPLWRAMAGMRPVLTFALGGQADVTADAMWIDDHWALTLHTPAGAVPLTLRLAGAHNAKNALAAATCALAAGAPLDAIRRGLEAFEPVKGRSQLKTFVQDGRKVALVDDSYNANPDSVRAAVDVLATLAAPRALLLGDMGEVGTRGPEFHAEVGAYARERGIEHLWCAGALGAHAVQAFGATARHFADAPAMVAALSELPAAASVLVKGSRFMQMERVVSALQG
ncbi:MAG TPA: UDP-N-acetylmuramoyl-tripeptide--D-alanyl-D-alanine ligase [Burkholderiaceae bacterium]|nr:UDP-N-acetylmuramoyl-tripeptide--D-alanyl-D-alanine ligase [Burkholderiaceae bacterium]